MSLIITIKSTMLLIESFATLLTRRQVYWQFNTPIALLVLTFLPQSLKKIEKLS